LIFNVLPIVGSNPTLPSFYGNRLEIR
jgi:hypothetical protein